MRGGKLRERSHEDIAREVRGGGGGETFGSQKRGGGGGGRIGGYNGQ